MNFLGAITTDVWPKHNQVRAVSVHIFLVKVAVENFDVATTTVNLLFMFHSKLNDQSLALVAELIEFCRDSIEPGILGSLETLNVKKIFYQVNNIYESCISSFDFIHLWLSKILQYKLSSYRPISFLKHILRYLIPTVRLHLPLSFSGSL